MTLDQLTNAPRDIWLGGESGQHYAVSALELGEWGTLQAWLKETVPDPVAIAFDQLARAKAIGTPIHDADRRELIRQARADAKVWPPRVGTRAWFDALEETEGGTTRFLWVALRKHQKGFTLEQAAELEKAMEPEESTELILRALGMEPAVPKGPAPAESPTTPATTTAPTLSVMSGEKSSSRSRATRTGSATKRSPA